MEENKVQNDFGHTILHFRLQKGLSQESLAEKCELDRTYISSVERGKRNISLINIIKLSNALEVTPSTLFQQMEEKK